MTECELDVILIHYWPLVMRRAMAPGSEDWLKPFVLSIAKLGKRPSWRPSPKQEQIMRRLVEELGREEQVNFDVIGR